MAKATFNPSVHKNILIQILKDIYSDTTISPLLGFKGGTAAYLFYGLNRDSVDLDFDLLDNSQEDYVFARITQIAEKYGSIKDVEKKRYTLFFLFSYEDNMRKVKIDISRRPHTSKFELKTYLGFSMLVMVKEDMFANKLLAMHERISKTSRDIYDVWFFLEQRFPINEAIIIDRAQMSCHELLQKCIDQLENMKNRDILNGLGELLSESQKSWARMKLRTETILLLKIRIESEK